MNYPVFSSGLAMVLASIFCFLIIAHLIIKSTKGRNLKSKKTSVKFYLFFSAFSLALLSYDYYMFDCNSELTTFSLTWGQLSTINQVTKTNIWPWYSHVLYKLICIREF